MVRATIPTICSDIPDIIGRFVNPIALFTLFSTIKPWELLFMTWRLTYRVGFVSRPARA
jgi:hypothetical protein